MKNVSFLKKSFAYDEEKNRNQLQQDPKGTQETSMTVCKTNKQQLLIIFFNNWQQQVKNWEEREFIYKFLSF